MMMSMWKIARKRATGTSFQMSPFNSKGRNKRHASLERHEGIPLRFACE